MTLRLGGYLLVFYTLTTSASPFPNILELTSDTLQTSCNWFSGLVQFFPTNPPRIERVFFELRTPCKRTQYAVSDAKQVRSSPYFDAKRPTVILANGWLSTINDSYSEELTKAYLCRGGYNVIMVNTKDFLLTEYTNSAYNTEKLGQFVAVGIKNLNTPGSQIHLLGHSLGAHIMGSAARHFASATGDKIGRVTGFDPARPCFIKNPVFRRLSVDDASFVDIIHSNPTETGTEEAIGHADFYPGGLTPTQPGCLTIDLLCSHVRSVKYFAETIYPGNENNFMGPQCGSFKNLIDRKCTGTKAPMGFSTAKTSLGIYLLDVNSAAPFGKNAKNAGYLKLDKCGVCTK